MSFDVDTYTVPSATAAEESMVPDAALQCIDIHGSAAPPAGAWPAALWGASTRAAGRHRRDPKDMIESRP